MRFDDRLRTVLAMPALSSHDTAVRWRQLVELAARAPADGDHGLIDQALGEIRDDMDKVEERVRVAATLAIAPLPLPASLVGIFASDQLAVAAPVLAAARLTASEWKTVTASASAECRSFISVMRSDAPQSAPAQLPPHERDTHDPIPSISEVVARIERLRQPRDEDLAPADAAASTEEPRLFRWECNEAGEIDWVEGVPRGALVGQSIAHLGTADSETRPVERAFAARAPFHDAVLDLPGEASVSGKWKISGIPAFERSTGRFAGYRGVAERPDAAAEAGDGPDADSLRELAHEIRTPLNAIIGFAEIISGEYLGPAETRYRERAAGIVAEARLLLTAIEDLDFAARMSSEFAAEHPRFHLDELLESMIPEIEEAARDKPVGVEFVAGERHVEVAFHPELAQRLILRLCTALFTQARAGETVRVWIEKTPEFCRLVASRPPTSEGGPIENGSLRLAGGLAKVGGARLAVEPDTVALSFPRI